nr:23S rRNA (guanosine(2251)-2'-O)-methyltransferase RlmB [Breznakibacter sp.]
MAGSDYIFGIRALMEAVASGKTVEKVFIKKGLTGDLSKELFDVLRANGITYQFVPIEKLNRITRGNHQGVIALSTSIVYQRVEDVIMNCFEAGKIPFIVVLDGVTDVRNFGAIARSAECSGVDAIVFPEK